MENTGIGISPIASALGAKVSVASPGRGMYLVSGRGVSPEAMVRSMNGEVVLRLSSRKLLATLPFTGYLRLHGNRDIASIGPVTVDINRLSEVAETLVKTTNPGSGTNAG